MFNGSVSVYILQDANHLKPENKCLGKAGGPDDRSIESQFVIMWRSVTYSWVDKQYTHVKFNRVPQCMEVSECIIYITTTISINTGRSFSK